MKRILFATMLLVASCAKKESNSLVNPHKPMFSVWTNAQGSFDFTWAKIGYSSGVSGQYQGINCVYTLNITGNETVAIMNYSNGLPNSCKDFHIDLLDDGITLSYCNGIQCLYYN